MMDLSLDELMLWEDPEKRTGPEHMAMDELLALEITKPVLRTYRWFQDEITFGYAMRWQAVEPMAGCRPATRRLTGGGIVEHGSDLTLALWVPSTEGLAQMNAKQCYRAIHEAIALSLRTDVPGVRLAAPDDCKAGAVCFSSPTCDDLLDGNRKILGGAQRRSRAGMLYQGSLIRVPDSANVAPRIAAQLARSVTQFDAPELPDPTELVESRYGSQAWTTRR